MFPHFAVELSIIAVALRRNPSRRVRRIALWAKRWRKRDGVMPIMSLCVSERNASDGAKSCSTVGVAI